MKGLRYQLKSVVHDKFCLMSFLLPIVVAAVLNLMGSIDFSSLGELQFGVLKEDLSVQAVTWLERYGPVTAYPTPEELAKAINEPSTNVIGVEASGDGIHTILSGDELDMFRRTAETLPALYERRQAAQQAEVQILERNSEAAGFQDLFIAVTLIVAMFMGCTFNAMNMISEKEDGVAFINEILPMTRSRYVVQKLSVGFLFGFLSSVLTACICFRLSWQGAALMLVLIVLSAFVAALMGLFIGRISEGLMVGVVYIKMVMLIFMAVPILSFLVGVSHPLLSAICYLVPSQATFEGIIDLSAGVTATAIQNICILSAHGVGWFLLYVGISSLERKNA